jgi:hypothetical protein
MKKTIVTLVVMLFAAAGAFAQIEKGTILVGASSNLSFISEKPKDGDGVSTIDLNVKGGYFIIDNLALGLNIGYNKFSEADDATTIFGLFGRYYINGKIFVGAGFNSAKQGDLSITQIPLELGYAAFITDNIAIEPAINYSMISGDYEGSQFGLNVGFTLYLNRGE